LDTTIFFEKPIEVMFVREDFVAEFVEWNHLQNLLWEVPQEHLAGVLILSDE
jgi:hypothetical protein